MKKKRRKYWWKLSEYYNCAAVTVIADCNACGGRKCGQTKELMREFFEQQRAAR